MSENVKNDRTRQTEECDQPKQRAEREEPEFFTGPESLRDGRARECREKCLGENRAERQKKNRDDKL
jgi:hypothetical protein